MFELGQQNGRLKQGEFNPNNAVMQFPVPGMPASRWQGFTSLWLVFLCQRDAGIRAPVRVAYQIGASPIQSNVKLCS